MYIKATSPLVSAGIQMVTQFPIDPICLIFLRVVKILFLNYFLNSSSPTNLSQKLERGVDQKVTTIHDYIPSDFSRKPRTFSELRRWKATVF